MLNLRIFCRHPSSLQDFNLIISCHCFTEDIKEKTTNNKRNSEPDIQKSLNGNFVLLIKIILMINNDYSVDM